MRVKDEPLDLYHVDRARRVQSTELHKLTQSIAGPAERVCSPSTVNCFQFKDMNILAVVATFSDLADNVVSYSCAQTIRKRGRLFSQRVS